MTFWIRAYDGENDRWSFFELDDDEWPLRPVDFQGPRRHPVTAASMAEIADLHARGDFAAMRAYERRYGVLVEGDMRGWQEEEEATRIGLSAFEEAWAAAREALDVPRAQETG